MDIEDDNIIQELEESATEHALSTDKNASTPTKTNTTKAQADNGSKNPAQAKVNRALNTITAYRDKLNMLKNRAAEKANEKKEARKARSVKKSQHTQSDDNDASEQDSDSVNDSGNDTDSNDDDKNKNKKTKKTKKSKSTSKAKSTTHDDPNNYYNAMNKKVSDMSKTERKKIFSYCFFLSSSSVQFATCFFVKLIQLNKAFLLLNFFTTVFFVKQQEKSRNSTPK